MQLPSLNPTIVPFAPPGKKSRPRPCLPACQLRVEGKEEATHSHLFSSTLQLVRQAREMTAICLPAEEWRKRGGSTHNQLSPSTPQLAMWMRKVVDDSHGQYPAEEPPTATFIPLPLSWPGCQGGSSWLSQPLFSWGGEEERQQWPWLFLFSALQLARLARKVIEEERNCAPLRMGNGYSKFQNTHCLKCTLVTTGLHSDCKKKLSESNWNYD